MSNKAAAEGRRSTRLPISLPIVIHGKDARRETFRESTHTLIVNQHGAKLLTTRQLVLGGEILIENTTLGSVAKANVAWVSPKYNPQGRNEVGIQFVEAQNIWGIEFPPDDWTLQEKEREAAASASSAPRPEPSEIAPGLAPSTSRASEAVAPRLLPELHESMEAYARQFRERLDEVVQQVGRQSEMDFRERAAAAFGQELTPLEQQVLASSERLGALKAEVQELEARITESQRRLYAAQESVPPALSSEQINEKIEAAAAPALHMLVESGIAAARERLQTHLQADAAQAMATWRSDLQVERDGLVQEARQQIVTALTSAVEEINRERDAGLEVMKRITEENLEKAVVEIQSKFDESTVRHGESLQKLLDETGAETRERQSSLLQTQLDALLVNRLEQAQRHAQSVGENLQTSFEEGLRSVGERSSRELQARLQELADKTAAASSEMVRKQVEESAIAAGEKRLERWEASLQDIADQAVASSSEQIRSQVEASANMAAEKGLQGWQTRMQEILDQTVASSAEPIRAQVEGLTQAAAEDVLQTWKARLQEVADHAGASAADQVQAKISEALSLLAPRLQDMQERAVNDAVAAFRGRISQLLGLVPAGGDK